MDQNQIKELIKLINQTEIGELKIQNGDFKISIRRKDYQKRSNTTTSCLLYTSDAADERSSVDLGGRRIIKKKHKQNVR